MADKADVRSLEQLEAFAQQLGDFRTQLAAEMESLLLELRRLSHWLQEDVLGYWNAELVQAQRRWSEARDVLSRCLACVREEERRPCTEERKRLRIAQQRLELCQHKLKLSRAALAAWETQCQAQHAKVIRCRDLAEADLQVASHVLAEHIEHLRRYLGPA